MRARTLVQQNTTRRSPLRSYTNSLARTRTHTGTDVLAPFVFLSFCAPLLLPVSLSFALPLSLPELTPLLSTRVLCALPHIIHALQFPNKLLLLPLLRERDRETESYKFQFLCLLLLDSLGLSLSLQRKKKRRQIKARAHILH